MRTMRTRRPKSTSVSARTTLARPAGFSSGATASSRSMHTASAALAAAFGIIAGFDAGTNSMLRVNRVTGSGDIILERPRHAEHVFANVRQDQVRGNGRHLVESRFPELPLDIVLRGK